MSIFNPKISVPHQEDKTPHPWEKYIKAAYSNTYKYGHTSANNPMLYPPKKEKTPSPDRVKFTVIGNRVTKEFIYCINAVKGLHKYRWKYFEAPVIRGVTSVEWPKVWNDLKLQYGGFSFCLQSQVAVLVNDQFLGGEKELKDLIESKYVYYVNPNYYDEAVNQFATYIKSTGRPFAYIQIAIDNDHTGTLIFMLYSDIVPRTCENFLRLCQVKKGGYQGTPVHRIVKDCWIQCGGFGIKDTEMDCENFIVPFDRRGVIGMANADRHIDCSTQFFVLLQPALWMAHKYVAFGQLVEGASTLQQIEEVPTWYESPTKQIVIIKAGVFNMDCQDITVNKYTHEYIQGHIENLFTIGELLYEALLEMVFLEVEFRKLQREEQDQLMEEGAAEAIPEEDTKDLRETRRFMRKKEEIDKHLEKAQVAPAPSTATKSENNEFDVESYEYEPEESTYKHLSIAAVSIPVKPEKPFYIPLTDVPYPGEIDSTYDLKKVLTGNYCHEVDLEKDFEKIKRIEEDELSVPTDILEMMDSTTTESESQESLESEDEKEIRNYLKNFADSVSFAGEIVKNMAKDNNTNQLKYVKKSDFISDEALRKFRMASMVYKSHREKKVSISVPTTKDDVHEIKRRQTGFARAEDLAKIKEVQKARGVVMEIHEGEVEEDEDDDVEIFQRQVTVTLAPEHHEPPKIEEKIVKRRHTGFVRRDDLEKVHIFQKPSTDPRFHDDEDEDEGDRRASPRQTVPGGSRIGRFSRANDFDMQDGDMPRASVLTRLYDDVTVQDEGQGPTLKGYKPISEHQKHSIFLTTSSLTNARMMNEEDPREKYIRHSIHMEPTYKDEKTIDHILELQHGKVVGRKISSDYVKTIGHIEHKINNSIRSVEFARKRPALSINEYQKKNQEYQQILSKTKMHGGNTQEMNTNCVKKASIEGTY